MDSVSFLLNVGFILLPLLSFLHLSPADSGLIDSVCKNNTSVSEGNRSKMRYDAKLTKRRVVFECKGQRSFV